MTKPQKETQPDLQIITRLITDLMTEMQNKNYDMDIPHNIFNNAMDNLELTIDNHPKYVNGLNRDYIVFYYAYSQLSNCFLGVENDR